MLLIKNWSFVKILSILWVLSLMRETLREQKKHIIQTYAASYIIGCHSMGQDKSVTFPVDDATNSGSNSTSTFYANCITENATTEKLTKIWMLCFNCNVVASRKFNRFGETQFYNSQNHIFQKVRPVLKTLFQDLLDDTLTLSNIKQQVFWNWISKKFLGFIGKTLVQDF